ncbi:hypothetical protein [Aquimarina sp. SS2-1]
MLVLVLASCEKSSIEEETISEETDKPTIIHIHEEENHGLGD